MPTYLIKSDPDEDFYVLWSTIVDAPTAWGSRAELERTAYDPREVAAERFDRADERGTSADWPGCQPEEMPYHWTHDEWMVRACILPYPDYDRSWWVLPRANLRAFCERLSAGSDATDLLHLEHEADQ